ncbi:MAG TPA: HEAT repeat domain-containing protein [Chloroflexia bacterium]|nr:HEAT repeat domain-containing protein [Chloroflexia bacterium]
MEKDSKETSSVQAILPLIKSSTTNLSDVVLKTLAGIDVTEVPTIIQLLENVHPKVCHDLINVLAWTGDSQVINPLIDILTSQSKQAELRDKAAFALSSFGENGLLACLSLMTHEDEEVRFRVAQTLANFVDERVVTALLLGLKDFSWKVRACSATSLSRMNDSRTVEALIQALADQQEVVRLKVTEALGKCGNIKASEALLKVLKDENVWIRYHAAIALSKCGDKQAATALIEVLNDEDIYVRGAAAQTLATIGDENAIEPLIQALYDKDVNVRRYAAFALGRCGNEQAIAALESVIQSDSGKVSHNYSVKNTAIEAVARIRQKHSRL